MQDKQEMELGTRCLAENYRQCSHKSNYDACGSAHGRLDYRGAGNDGCHHRGRSRLRARSAITCKCGGVRCSGNRLRKRSRSNTYYRSSSSESDRRSADSFCRNCDSVFKYCSSVHETEKQTHKLNLVCSSHGFIHTSSTNVHKHSYSHCRQRVVRSNHGLCSCPYRKRQHKNYSIDHDVDASMFRRRSEPIWCKHRTRYHKLGSASPHGICQGKPQEDRKCSPFGPVACKSKVVSPMRGCTKHTCFPYLAHNVQPADVCAVGHVEITSESKEGSLNINREWNGLFTSCTNGNSEVINAQTEKQKHQDQWLQLSLKAPQHSKLMVEGVSKSDLKLSLPEVTRQSNMEDCIPCGSSEMRTRKQIGGNECSNPTSAIDFQNRSRRMDPSLYHQPMENLYYLNVQHASSSVPDLNLSPKILNVCSGIIAPVTWSKAELDPPQNCHDSHAREEPNLLVLNHRNWGSSEYEENVPVFKHADVQNPKFPHNEELRGLHLGDPHFKATSISGAADCGNENLQKISCEDINSHQNALMTEDVNINNGEISKATAGDVDDVGVRQCLAKSFKNKTGSGPTSSKESVLDLKYDKARTDKYMGTSFRKGHNAYNPQYLGQNLICEDISHGTEAVKISCTNDIDNASFPTFEYIHENRFSAQATVILESVLSNTEKQAKACEGCDEFDMDDPEAAISVHISVNECKRDQDKRIDWQGEPMLGRLPYDRCGRLQLGSGTPDVVECNSKCPCGSNCLNCELQKGLQVSLEVFRTEDNEWGVRALEQIPRIYKAIHSDAYNKARNICFDYVKLLLALIKTENLN